LRVQQMLHRMQVARRLNRLFIRGFFILKAAARRILLHTRHAFATPSETRYASIF
jgi:hypothetical protein